MKANRLRHSKFRKLAKSAILILGIVLLIRILLPSKRYEEQKRSESEVEPEYAEDISIWDLEEAKSKICELNQL